MRKSFPIIALAFAVIVAPTVLQADETFTSESTWAESVSGITTINFEGIAPAHSYNYYGTGPSANVTVGGVNFAVGASGTGDNLFVIGDGFYYPFAVLSVQGNPTTQDLLIDLPTPVTALAFDFATFESAPGTITLSDGTIIPISTGSNDFEFFGVTSSAAITSVDITETGGGVLNLEDFSSATVTPEPGTAILWLTGILLMIATRKRIARILRLETETHGSLSPH
jgi:hypothetical protein